jgi:[ribosomal protein S5]-alanine N-acetyltransferase
MDIGSGYTLSRYRREDTKQLIKHLSNPRISENLREPPFPYTQKDADWWLDFLEDERTSNPLQSSLRWTIRDKELIGDISLRENNGYFLGYWLADEYWGKGIMTRAVSAILQVAAARGIKKITADVREGNWGSRKVLEKNGFTFEGEGEGKMRGPAKVWYFNYETR